MGTRQDGDRSARCPRGGRGGFRGYERALVSNDVATLDRLFWNSPLAIRYGASENLYGYDEILAFKRRGRSLRRLDRTLMRTVITTYRRDFAVASTLFARDGSQIGRQSQTWVRTAEGSSAS